MPPKRRQTTELASAAEPTKRVTRSSTKATALIEPGAAELPKLEPKAPKATTLTSKAGRKPQTNKDAAAKPNTGKPNANAEASKEDGESAEPTSTPSNATSLTISSELMKNPIQCALYTYTPRMTGSGGPPNPFNTQVLIFTHGAGGSLSAPAVMNFCTGFSTAFCVLAFQGSMNLRSRAKGFHACIEHVESERRESKKKCGGKRAQANGTLLGGRSMGARAAVMAASEFLEGQDEDHEQVQRKVELILVSYPLQGPKDVRDQILLDLPASVSVLFIIGSNDAMCPLDLLNEVRKKMKADSHLIVVRGADHGMHVKPASKEKAVGEETGRLATKWLCGSLDGDVTYIGEGG